MADHTKRLGRGMSSLISGLGASRLAGQLTPEGANLGASDSPGPANIRTRTLRLPLDYVVPNRHQPRRSISDGGIEALAESIRQNGIIQPVLVRPAAPGGGSTPGDSETQHTVKYELIAGERRWRAARAAGLTEIPAIVRDATEQQSLELALVENIQREGLNPIDRALAYREFRDQFGLTADQIGSRVGEDRTTVTNYLRLLELAEVVRDMVASDLISMGHARALAGLRSKQDQQTLAEGIVRKGLSVRALEGLIRQRRGVGRARVAKLSGANKKRPLIRDLERRFSQALQTKVSIQEASRKNHGKIVIEYHSLDGFESICERLGI